MNLIPININPKLVFNNEQDAADYVDINNIKTGEFAEIKDNGYGVVKIYNEAEIEFEVMNNMTNSSSKTEIIPKSESVNIYAGTNENAELSNFAKRPFTDNVMWGEEFNTVEGAFQAAKLGYTEYYNDPNPDENGISNLTNDEGMLILEKLQIASGAQAKKIGKTIKGLNIKKWDADSKVNMKQLLTESFEQNPKALQTLLETGNAKLTHTQDKGKWGKQFPKILMEVRDEFIKTEIIPETKEGETSKPDSLTEVEWNSLSNEDQIMVTEQKDKNCKTS